MTRPYLVGAGNTTDYEPIAGWYFETEREEDSAPIIHGPFYSRLEADEYCCAMEGAE